METKNKSLIIIFLLLLIMPFFAGCGEQKINVLVDSIEISKKNLYLAEGQTAVISAQVYPFNASNQRYTFSSSNDEIVTIENGFVVAKKAGDAIISVISDEGGYKDTCNVLVTKASENLALNNYNNLNMPKKDLDPIFNTQSQETSKKMPILKNIAKRVNAEISEDKDSYQKVIDEMRTELKNSINDLEEQKNILKNNSTFYDQDSIFSSIENIETNIINSIQQMKKTMLDNLDETEQKINEGEYTVESKNVDGITYVVIKSSNSTI